MGLGGRLHVEVRAVIVGRVARLPYVVLFGKNSGRTKEFKGGSE